VRQFRLRSSLKNWRVQHDGFEGEDPPNLLPQCWGLTVLSCLLDRKKSWNSIFLLAIQYRISGECFQLHELFDLKMPRSLKVAILIPALFGCVLLLGPKSRGRRTVSIERFPQEIQLMTIESTRPRLHSMAEIWSDLYYRHQLALASEETVWLGCFWMRGSGQPLPGGGHWYQFGKDAWTIGYGDCNVSDDCLGFGLDEVKKTSWVEWSPSATNSDDPGLRRALTTFLRTAPKVKLVTSWEDYLRQVSTGSIEVAWGA
jgi:hypothetical protein